jgi:branched-chain amino acid transport system substrate-binding protein
MSRTLAGLLWLTLVAVLLPLTLLVACQEQAAPLKIGFIGGLTGRVSGLGVDGRDAVLLAVEEYNRAGGLHGRQLEVLVRDDRQDAETAGKVFRELIDDGVVALIGPMTSSMAVVLHPLVNQARVVMVSPTVTANRFNDLDDYFYRMTMPLKVNAEKQAVEVLRRGLKRIAVSVDTTNAAYTEDVLASFRQPFEAGGGRVVAVERFRSGAEGGLLLLAGRLLREQPDSILLLSGAMDTALIAQQLRKLGSPLPLFTSEWSFTSDVISFGGGAVEGLQSYVTYNPVSTAPRHTEFLADFEQRFGYTPSFAAVLAYEATRLLIAGLERNPRREGLKAALDGVDSITGLQGEVRINRFGDSVRLTYLAVIRNQRFTTID